MTRITTCPDGPSAAVRAAGDIARLLRDACAERGEAHLALSGGTTPALTYELLAREDVDWNAVHVWFADERCVDPEDPESNYRLARDTLLAPAGVPPERVHRMVGELPPAEGAMRYALEMSGAMPAGPGSAPLFDLIVLGIGPDGHIASLFPSSSATRAESPPTCIPVTDSPKPPPERLTLSLQVLRAARACLLLATGESKADAVAAMLSEPTDHVPASLLRRERLILIVDDEAMPGERP